jgi:5-formyltetrahydrofolate cyclo-ligase
MLQIARKSAPRGGAVVLAKPGSTALLDRKQELRARARRTREECDPAAAALLTEHVLKFMRDRPGVIVGAYWPIGAELDIKPLLFALHRRRHTIALPVTPAKGEPLTFRRWRPGTELVKEKAGTWRPEGPEAVPDILLVPLLAFDARGRRLGYGAGYYDSTIESLPGVFTLGIAYAAQEVDEVPAGPHDKALDAIATENGIMMARTRNARTVSRRRSGTNGS